MSSARRIPWPKNAPRAWNSDAMEYIVRSFTAKSRHHFNNEDHCLVCDDYIIVADGMGGQCAGDMASRIAVESIASVLAEGLSNASSEYEIRELSDKAIRCADTAISEYVMANPDSFGMGTTVLLAVRKDDMLFISWCGDSHCYTYKDGKIKSLTKDHSFVQELIDSGHITVEESFTHPDNNLITRFVGGGEDACVPDFCMHRMADSEIIILCSDGLSGYCKPDDIARLITRKCDVDVLPEHLSELAVRSGSDDDITIVVLAPDNHATARSSRSIFGWFRSRRHHPGF